MTRRIIEDPNQVPALTLAIAAAKEIGCRVNGGYCMGDTIVGLMLTSSQGRAFSVELTPHNWRSGAKILRRAAARLG